MNYKSIIVKCFKRVIKYYKVEGEYNNNNNNHHHLYSHKQLHGHGTYKALSTQLLITLKQI